MSKFQISITYTKVVDAADKEEAEGVISTIAERSNLDAENGPFSTLDCFLSVEEVKE